MDGLKVSLIILGTVLLIAATLIDPFGRKVLAGVGLVIGGFVLLAFLGSGSSRGSVGSNQVPTRSRFPMTGDHVVGDGGNCTVYERPDGSQYALDAIGRGGELPYGTRTIGTARFDSRSIAIERGSTWAGSRSLNA